MKSKKKASSSSSKTSSKSESAELAATTEETELPQGKFGVDEMKAKWLNFIANGQLDEMNLVAGMAQETFDRGLELEDVLEGEEFSRAAEAIAKSGWVPKLSDEQRADMDFEADSTFDDASDDEDQIEMDMDEDEGYF